METKALFTVLVAFTNGEKTYNVGEQDEVREDFAKSWEEAGYIKLETEQKDLSTLEYTELKALAKEKGIKGYTTMSKEKLLEALKEA
jgi:hypothetical protein